MKGIVHACQDIAPRGDYSRVGESVSESAPVHLQTWNAKVDFNGWFFCSLRRYLGIRNVLYGSGIR